VLTSREFDSFQEHGQLRANAGHLSGQGISKRKDQMPSNQTGCAKYERMPFTFSQDCGAFFDDF